MNFNKHSSTGDSRRSESIIIALLFILIIIVLAISQSFLLERSQQTLIYGPNATFSLIMPKNWEKVWDRGGIIRISKRQKKDYPTTSIVLFNTNCKNGECENNFHPSYTELVEEFNESEHFEINDEWIYLENGYEFTWFSYKMAQEDLKGVLESISWTGLEAPENPSVTVVKIRFANNITTALILNEERSYFGQFEAEEIVKSIRLRNNN